LKKTIEGVGINAEYLLIDDVVRKAIKVAIEYAKKHRLIISFDLNLRLSLWDSMENTVDTTGAGDTFCGCVLNYILESGREALSEGNLREILTFANAAAALVTTKKGAICVVPTKDEIIEFLKSRN